MSKHGAGQAGDGHSVNRDELLEAEIKHQIKDNRLPREQAVAAAVREAHEADVDGESGREDAARR